ncbi:hypothetical protein M413DRAFT_13524 [Hebeloma cylindrosporum]|uniref:Uncharacterized protein n=1 Tax=Hebeloma cylindrosporum TaxID=76867 RepID=A0A0C2XH48_HEBCY|nr:hypothetical protein M413DRAFT_13524 [Hebeloma cylindrosporum h7]
MQNVKKDVVLNEKGYWQDFRYTVTSVHEADTLPISTFHNKSNPENGEKEYDISDFKIMSSVPMLDHLSINISGPDVRKKPHINWWPHQTFGAYSNILVQLSLFEQQVKAIKAQTMFDLDELVSLVSDTTNTLCPSFHFLFDLEALKEEDPDPDYFCRQLEKDFCLKPHGLGRVINHLYQLYLLLTNYFQHGAMSHKVVLVCLEQMKIFAAPLLNLEFCGSMFCALYDPQGISDFQDVLRKHRNYFAVHLCNQLYYYFLTDLQDVDAKKVVDVFPTQDPRYSGLMNLFSEFCEILVKRTLNVSKSSGKKKQWSTSQNTDLKGYNTWSAQQPGAINRSSSDSEASSVFEYEPSSKEEEKFH